MIYQKLICIDEKNDKLTFNKVYIGKRPGINNPLFGIFDNGKPIGLFPSRMFKTLNQYRNDRLKNIFNE